MIAPAPISMAPPKCVTCRHYLPAILNVTDHRCAWLHRVGRAEADAAYPTLEWMMSLAGACGPQGSLHEEVGSASPT